MRFVKLFANIFLIVLWCETHTLYIHRISLNLFYTFHMKHSFTNTSHTNKPRRGRWIALVLAIVFLRIALSRSKSISLTKTVTVKQ